MLRHNDYNFSAWKDTTNLWLGVGMVCSIFFGVFLVSAL